MLPSAYSPGGLHKPSKLSRWLSRLGLACSWLSLARDALTELQRPQNESSILRRVYDRAADSDHGRQNGCSRHCTAVSVAEWTGALTARHSGDIRSMEKHGRLDLALTCSQAGVKQLTWKFFASSCNAYQLDVIVKPLSHSATRLLKVSPPSTLERLFAPAGVCISLQRPSGELGPRLRSRDSTGSAQQSQSHCQHWL